MRFDHITSSKVVKLVICEVVNLAVIEAREPVRRRAILVLGRSGHDLGENGAAKPIWRCSSETQQKRSAAARDRRAGVDRSGCQTRLLDVNAMQIRECSFTKAGGETAATAALPSNVSYVESSDESSDEEHEDEEHEEDEWHEVNRASVPGIGCQ